MTFTFRHIAVIAALTSGTVGALHSAQAQTRYVSPQSAQTYYAQANTNRTQAKISYAQAKSIALRRHPGSKYVGMQLSGNTYIVRVEVSRGRVIDVRVDAATGRVR